MTIYVVGLEKLENRYTTDWYSHIPELLRNNGFDVVSINGPDVLPENNMPGAFLNFGATNAYKAAQLDTISRMFCNNEIANNDYFLFTDAWNPTIINLKYMASLMNVDIKIGGLWHAGNYDAFDHLGRIAGDTSWIKKFEQSLYYALDHNFFATDFHIDMFCRNVLYMIPSGAKQMYSKKIIRTGWPMEYMCGKLEPFADIEKENIILFPHRISPEKQLDIFKDLEQALPQYKFVVCQEQQLSKCEYHTLLAKSKLVLSFSKQETLGIAMAEAAILNAIPLVPDSLSYSEMYSDTFKYPANYTSDFDAYSNHKPQIIKRIVEYIEHWSDYTSQLHQLVDTMIPEYFNAANLITTIKGS
jgi:hypothetical protein